MGMNSGSGGGQLASKKSHNKSHSGGDRRHHRHNRSSNRHSSHDDDHHHQHKKSSSKSSSSSKRTVPLTKKELEAHMNKTQKLIKYKGGSSFLDKRKRAKSGKKKHNKKVTFAVNPKKNSRIWELVREFEKVPESLHETLWWTPDEMHDRYEQDQDLLDVVDEEYVNALDGVYYGKQAAAAAAATKSAGAGRHHWETILRLGASVRGCEGEFTNEIRNHVRNHCKAVLTAQTLIRERMRMQDSDDDSDGDDSDSDDDISKAVAFTPETASRVMRTQSERFSQKSLQLALKLAELDRHRQVSADQHATTTSTSRKKRE